jgi:lysophospholipase L1-like esterase
MKYVFRFVLFCTSVVITCVALEFYLRHINYSYRPHSWVFASEEFYQDTEYRNFYTTDFFEIFKPDNDENVMPEYWQTDDLGFRYNPAHTAQSGQKPEETWIAVGDSFVYGHGVSDTENWVSLLEKGVSARKNRKIQIHNAGVPATGTDQQLIRFQRLVKEYRPTTAVWVMNFNDAFDDKYTCLYKEVLQDRYIQLPAVLNIAYINGKLMQTIPKKLISTRLGNLLTTATIHGYDMYTLGCSTQHPEEDGYASYFKKLGHSIRQVKAFAQKENVQLQFVLAPRQTYFDPAYPSDHWDFQFFQRYKDTFAANNVSLLDMNQEIARHTDQKLLLYREDKTSNEKFTSTQYLHRYLFLDEASSELYGNWHLNAFGNELFAQILLNTVK